VQGKKRAEVNQQAPVQDEADQAVLGMKPKHIQVVHFCFPLPLPRVFPALFSAPKFSPPQPKFIFSPPGLASSLSPPSLE